METNKIYCGDNLQIMKELPEDSVDLIYLDPPFFSQKHYEQIWGDKDEVRSFEDRWSGGITHYVGWMVERLKEMHRILKPTGSIYLHCDWHASHYLKIEMDKIFGYNNFRNEIVWQRTTHPKGSDNQSKKFGVSTDSIFYFSKSDNYIFNIDNIKIKLTQDELLEKYHKTDENGRYYNGPIELSNGMAPPSKGLIYEYKGYSPKIGWRMLKDKLMEVDKKGDLGWTKNKTPFKKLRVENDKGQPMYNLWDDINRTGGKESLGYPTQKPEALLERIILASSNPGDIVFDPFCGCGTTVSVAKRLNRRFIGIDISPKACRLIATRIHYPEFDIIGLPMTTDDLSKMSHNEFQQWVCDKMMARNTSPNHHQHSGGDGGIDGIIQSNLFTGKYAASPIQVTQSESVGVNKIRNFYAVMTTDMKKSKGFIIALSFGSGAVEQVAKYKKDHNVDIKLIKAEDLCNVQHYDYGVKVVNSEDI